MRINADKIKSQLVDLGLKPGCVVALAVSFKEVGRLAGGARIVIDSILEIVGDEGGILAPSYTGSYSLIKVYLGIAPVFDINTTKSKTGGLAELMLEKFGATRSSHPTNSMVGIGAKAEMVLSRHSAFSDAYSPYSDLAKLNGFALNIGIGDNLVGLRHEAQSLANLLSIVKYRMGVKYMSPNKDVKLFKRKDVGGCTKKLNMLTEELREMNLLREGLIGNASALMVDASVALNYMSGRLMNQPEIYLCSDKLCVWCREVDSYLNSHNLTSSTTFNAMANHEKFITKIKSLVLRSL